MYPYHCIIGTYVDNIERENPEFYYMDRECSYLQSVVQPLMRPDSIPAPGLFSTTPCIKSTDKPIKITSAWPTAIIGNKHDLPQFLEVHE